MIASWVDEAEAPACPVDRRRIKRRVRSMLGFKSTTSMVAGMAQQLSDFDK